MLLVKATFAIAFNIRLQGCQSKLPQLPQALLEIHEDSGALKRRSFFRRASGLQCHGGILSRCKDGATAKRLKRGKLHQKKSLTKVGKMNMMWRCARSSNRQAP